MLSADVAGGFAVTDDAKIFTHNTAYGNQADHRAGECAVQNGTATGADDPADTALAAARRDRAHDIQISDPTTLLKIAEQPLM